MSADWIWMFDAFGVKQVTRTDKSKAAYVLTQDQCHVLEGAGVLPAASKPAPGFLITVLFDDRRRHVEASYYHSEREGAGRLPEPRMGHAIISSWLREGDYFCLSRIGSQLFAFKMDNAPVVTEVAAKVIVDSTNAQDVFRNAGRSIGHPSQRTIQTTAYVRNPWVVRAAVLRSGGRCEMPGCRNELFLRDDGSVYLEVHHVIPLGEGGGDHLGNVAALCPRCHRELHFGMSRYDLRQVLMSYVYSLSV